jgi:hypothetical protein
MPVRANPHSTGDGLRMGRAVGASLAGPMDGFHGHLVPSPLERFGPPEFVALSQYHSRYCVLVNQEGRRFTCEKWGDEVSNLALLRQPGCAPTCSATSACAVNMSATPSTWLAGRGRT